MRVAYADLPYVRQSANQKVAEYQAEHLAKWTADERWLVDVERRYFDYQDSMAGDPDDSFDEDDE